MTNRFARIPNTLDQLITTEVVDVTPQMAENWLKKNHDKQRRIAWARVESFAGDMASGNWVLTHQGICFGASGGLIDGQHRLRAVIKSGRTVRMLVIHNREGQFETPIDRGRPRALANISGIPHRRIAALNCLRHLEQGYVDSVPLTLSQVDELLDHHGKVLSTLDTVNGFYRFHAGLVAGCAWVYPIAEGKVVEFISQVHTGELLAPGEPALALRRWTDRVGRGEIGKRIKPFDMAMVACNCLRHKIIDRTLEKIYTGMIGYKAITSQRRKNKIPHTPTTELVESEGLE